MGGGGGRSARTVEVRRVVPPVGGALRGMGESVATDSFTGAATLTVPIPVTEARDLTPDLALEYSSLAGNGVFGVGFGLALPSVARRTTHGVPRYEDSDVFVHDGAALVPCARRVETRDGTAFDVAEYRPRAERAFDRIERWCAAGSTESFWVVTTTSSTTTVYGRSAWSRVSDPADPERVVEWLPELSYEPRGSAVRYRYKREDTAGTGDALYERGRTQTANRYPERVSYGNEHPFAPGDDPDAATWLFEVVFDYGEYDVSPANDDPYVPVRDWTARPDAFSVYDAGFERRTHRLCRNVLLFHRFPEIAAVPVLVDRLRLGYDERPDVLSCLVEIERAGYRYRGDRPAGQRYDVAALAPVRLGWTAFEPPAGGWRPMRGAEGIGAVGAVDAAVPGSVLVDLYGDGLAGVFYAAGATVQYARPALDAAGAVAYVAGSPQPFPPERTLAGAVALSDVAGDGRLDAVVTAPGRAGYHPNIGEGAFGPLVPFVSYPVALDPEHTEFADLTGDGRADAVVVESTVVRYLPSLGARGYGAPVVSSRAPGLPVSTPESATELLAFAPVSGAGADCRVRVRDGVVECWPSLGHGRFGPMVTLARAPTFPAFDARRVRLVDVDGSGVADLAYVYPDRVEVYRNLAGNAFAAEPVTIALPAAALTPEQVSFADVAGTGTDAVVFAQPLAPGRQWSHPLAERRPYLLSTVDNGTGARTTIRYESSSHFQLADRRDGRPWLTTLPFPVQVVAEVETADLVAQAVSRYSLRYHDGYYDPVDREFRGFGMVERWDTDRASALVPPGGPDVVAPSLTREWFLTGAWELEERLLAQYRAEWFHGDPAAYRMPGTAFEWATAPTPAARRQACAVLAGHPLRTEVYGLDGTAAQAAPYVVTEHGYAVRELQPPAAGGHGVFLVVDRESISYEYERDAVDPRVAHQFALRHDAFGNLERVADVAYRRRPGRPGTIDAQRRTWFTFATQQYVAPRVETAVYLAGLPREARSYEIAEPPPPADGAYYSVAEVAALVDAALGGGPVAATLLGAQRVRYVEQSPGVVTPQALLVGTEQAAFGDLAIREVFAATPIAADLARILRDEAGYSLEADGYWWAPGATQAYLDAGRFYAPASVTDPFAAGRAAGRSGTVATYTWDTYALAVLAVEQRPSVPDVMPVRVEVLDYDYRTMTARAVRDANGVVSDVLQDPLGRVVVTSHRGSELHDGVVRPVGFAPLAADERWPVPASLADLLADPAAYLRGAATFVYYALPGDVPGERPASVTTVAATEYPDGAVPRGAAPISVVYADGAGRVVQESAKAEPGPGAADDRWRVSGRVRFNAKGEPFRRYEPFFAPTYEFVTDRRLVELGVSPTLRYDPLGRVVRVDVPRGPFEDAFFSTVEHRAWETTVSDTDDTVTRSRYYRYYVDEGHSLPEPERAALLQAARLSETPDTTRLDALGRPVWHVARLGGPTGAEELVTSRAFRVTGEELWSADPRLGPLGVRNLETTYALRGDALRTASVDGGESYRVVDVAGDVVVSVDPRGHVVTAAYDSRARVTTMTVRPPAGAAFVARRFVYGDSLDAQGASVHDPAGRNVVDRVVVAYDEAGRAAVDACTLGGEPLGGGQRLLASYDTPGDWAGSEPTWRALFDRLDGQLAGETFTTAAEYDALGRPVAQTDPGGNRWFDTYHVSGLLDTVSVEPRGETRRAYVAGTAYTAYGDRERVRYDAPGGGALLTTTYTHDPYDLRLTGVRTVRESDGAVLQDLAYWYDPVGNPTSVTDAAAPVQRVVHAQQVVTPDRSYEYDSLYRLVGATGRAHTAYSRADLRTGSYAPYFSPAAHPNDVTALERYSMTFGYDHGNNLVRTAYAAASAQWAQTISVADGSNRAVEDARGRGTVPAGAFDAAGNPRYLDALPALAWDHRGALTAAVVVARPTGDDDVVLCAYRADGDRVRKAVRRLVGGGVETTVTVYLGAFELHRETRDGDVVSEYVRLRVMDGDRCAVQVLRWTVGTPPGGGPAEQHRYQLEDAFGSSVVEVDATGRLVSYEEYAPYGGTTYASGESLAEVSRKHYRFAGKERDTDTGLSYFGMRYYAPWLGRWISPDPAGPVDGLNLYEYVLSSPLAYADPRGLGSKKKKTKVDPKKTVARADALALFGKGRSGFYPALKDIARKSRAGNVAARKKATSLAKRMTHDAFFREEVAKRVRVRAVRAGGAKKGYGKDEVFQTSETAFVFKASAGLVPGFSPVAYFKTGTGKVEEITLLDAQEHVRLDTSIVPSKEGGGHTGMILVTKSGKGYNTAGQAKFHAARTTTMKNAASTGEAIVNTFATHIHATADIATITKKHRTGFTVSHQDLSKAKDRAEFVNQMARVRDQNKLALADLSTRIYDDPSATTLSPYTQAPQSPLHDPTYAPSGLPKAKKAKTFGEYCSFALPTYVSTKK